MEYSYFMSLEGKNILVTGAAGFIGSSLVKKLLESNVKIIGLDNINDYYSKDLKRARLKEINEKQITSKGTWFFYEASLENEKEIKFISSKNKFDIVIHLAATTDAASSFGKFLKIKKNNYENTKLISDLCVRYKKKLIFISSTSVYGSSNKIMYEDENNLNPQSPYADIKISEEKYIQKLNKNNNLKSLILRFGTIVGFSYGMRFHTAVNKFCYQASIGQPLSIWKTSLNQKRPYLGLNDACRSIEFLIKRDDFNGEKYNVLSKNLSVKNIVEIIKSYKKIKIKFVNNKIMNQLTYVVSTQKIEKLNFKFSDDLQKLILEELSYFDNINSE